MSHEKTQPLQNFVFLPLQLSSEHDNALAVSEATAIGIPLELLYGQKSGRVYRILLVNSHGSDSHHPPRSTRLKTINLYLIHNFDIKISDSRPPIST